MIKEIGLFGTCGKSRWRERIAIPIIEEAGKKYFNPNKKNWTPKDSIREYHHLTTDKVILSAISNETSSYGSLGELGWTILGALSRGQKVGLYFEEDLSKLKGTKRRLRELIKKHVKSINNKNFYYAKSIEDLAKWAVKQL